MRTKSSHGLNTGIKLRLSWSYMKNADCLRSDSEVGLYMYKTMTPAETGPFGVYHQEYVYYPLVTPLDYPSLLNDLILLCFLPGHQKSAIGYSKV